MSESKMKMPPMLKGNNVSLRPLVETDFEALYLCASDPEIWAQHPSSDRYKKEVFLKFFEKALQSKSVFVITDLKTNEVIGSSRYYDLDESLNQVSIGYTFLSRAYWGGAFNRELKSLMMNHAFQFVNRVIFDIGVTNIRSQKAIEKIGGIKIGQTLREGIAHFTYKIDKMN